MATRIVPISGYMSTVLVHVVCKYIASVCVCVCVCVYVYVVCINIIRFPAFSFSYFVNLQFWLICCNKACNECTLYCFTKLEVFIGSGNSRFPFSHKNPMGMGIATWEWEGTGIKNPFPNTSIH